MTGVLGLPLREALRRLAAEDGEIEVTRTAGVTAARQGQERVVRVSEDGRRLTVACFPDGAAREAEEE